MTAALRYAAAVVAAACCWGCGAGDPPPADAPGAAAIVRAALDHWRAGGAKFDPAAPDRVADVVSDPRWEAGWKLTRYELGETPVEGYQTRVKATLWLVDPKGATMKEAAEYVVTVAPKKTVVRSSEGW